MLLALRGFTATGVSFWAVVSRLTSTTKIDGPLELAAKLRDRGAVVTGLSATQAAMPSPASGRRTSRRARMGSLLARGTRGNMPRGARDDQRLLRRRVGYQHETGAPMTTPRSRLIAAAFDHGQIPTIACFSKATVDPGVDFDRLVAALQKFADQYFTPVWGTPARLVRTTGFRKGAWALALLDTADAVEEEEFLIDRIPMSDFVYPAWFEGFRKAGSAQFDYLKKVRRPFQILPGGYMPVFKNGRWTQIFGSRAKARRFARENRRGHRSTYRGRTHRMRPSRPRG